MRFLIVTYILLTSVLLVCGQKSAWVVQSIGVNEGLLSPDVWSLYQDQQLFIWVGTEAGASRFDGISFQNYTHAGDGERIGTVKAFTEINGHVVIGSDQGLFLFKKGGFVKCLLGDLNVSALLFTKDSTLWIGCSEGPYFIKKDKLTSLIGEEDFTPLFLEPFAGMEYDDLRITDIKEKPNGNILISTYYFIAEWNHRNLAVIWGVPDKKPDIQSISISSDQHFHWACDESHFYQYDQGVISEYGTLGGIPSSLINYGSGHLLLFVDQLHYYDRESTHSILEADESSEWLRKIMVDREGNIWVATFEGLLKIKSSFFIKYHPVDRSIYKKAYSIGERENGEIIFGGNRGKIWTIEDGKFFSPAGLPDKLFSTAEIFALFPDQDAIWFASGYQGIAKVEDGVTSYFTQAEGLGDNSRYFFFRDDRGKLWTGGDGGIDQIIETESGVEFQNMRYDLPNFTYASFLAAAPAPNDDFFLASTHGLFIKNNQGIIPIHLENASFSSLHVTDIIKSGKNELWMSTIGEGLLCCRVDTDGKVYLNRKVSRLEGLPTDAFLKLLQTKNGEIWAASYQGLCRIWEDNIDGTRFRFYDRYDGFPGESFNHIDLFQSASGTIWGATTAGVFSLDQSLLVQNRIEATPMITGVQILNAQEPVTSYAEGVSKHTGMPVEARLPHNRNFLRISFTGVSQTKPSDLKFRYKLEGLDMIWSDLSGERSVTYERLPAGNYNFLVEACNEDHIWSAAPASFSFEIIPAFYHRLWVQILGIFTGLFLLFQMIRMVRRKQQQDQFKSTIKYFANSNYTSNTVSEILWDLARNVISRLQFRDCVVYLLDPSSNLLHQVAAYGPKNPYGSEISNPISIRLGQGIVGAAAEQKKPQLVLNVVRDSRYIRDITSAGSELAVPIIHEGKVLGVIDSEHPKRRFFNQLHVEVLQRIAEQCAHKIASALVHEEMEARDKQLVKIQKEIAESKLTALQAQMNPHFIFNSLNSINWYIVKNRPEEASQYLTKFSRLVRLILDNSKKISIPLKKELETLELYLELESMRFEDKFNYHFQSDAEVDLEEVLVPPLILQPFLENAIWHGLMYKKGKGEILIQIYPENGHLKCIVQDNGIGRKAAADFQGDLAPSHQSKGIKLTSDRIQLMHDQFLNKETVRIMDLENKEGIATGTRVEIILPYDPE